MLFLREVYKESKVFTESDFYVPIKLVFGAINKAGDSILYCEFRGTESSLLEVKLCSNDGKIYSLAIIDVKRHNLEDESNIWGSVQDCKNGLPVFVVPLIWNSERIIDIDNNFKIQIIKNTIRIIFLNNKIILKITNGRINFGFDKDKCLCCIEINDLTEVEQSALQEYLNK